LLRESSVAEGVFSDKGFLSPRCVFRQQIRLQLNHSKNQLAFFLLDCVSRMLFLPTCVPPVRAGTGRVHMGQRKNNKQQEQLDVENALTRGKPLVQK